MDVLKALQSYSIALDLLVNYWWTYLPVLLFLGFLFAWLEYIQTQYFNSLSWTLLKIKPPPDVDRSPKAVEQIFAGLHGIYIKPVSWKEKLFKGKIPDWFSIEIVGQSGVTNFYIRTLTDYKNIVESNVFAQYPDAEISEAEDYMKEWPVKLPNEEYDVFGSELILSKEDAYPIQTYPAFEEKMAGLEQIKRLDPLSSLTEVFSTFRFGENFVIQLLVRPVSDNWVKKAQGPLDKLLGKELKKEENLIESMFNQIDKVFLPGVEEKKEDKKEKKLSAPEEEMAKAIGRKTSKIGFESGIRLMYIAKKEVFHRYHFPAVMGGFKQLATVNLNSFKVNKKTMTYSKGIFPGPFPSDKGFFVEQKTFEKKVNLFKDLKDRAFTQKVFVLNVEELATIFHLPGIEVQAPMLPRVEAKKGQPPAGLGIE